MVTNAIVPISPNALSVNVPSTQTVATMSQIAQISAKSGFLKSNAPTNTPQGMEQRYGDAFFLIMMGMEMGLSPILALKSLYVENGVPCAGVQTMMNIARRRGCKFDIPDPGSITDSARVGIQTPGMDEFKYYTFTTEMATAAKLTSKFNWKTYPQMMLLNRAVGLAIRWEAGDLVYGLYPVEEINPDIAVDETGTPIAPNNVIEATFEDSKPPTQPTIVPPDYHWSTINGGQKLYDFVSHFIDATEFEGTRKEAEARMLGLAKAENWKAFKERGAAGEAVKAGLDAEATESKKESQPAKQDSFIQEKTEHGHLDVIPTKSDAELLADMNSQNDTIRDDNDDVDLGDLGFPPGEDSPFKN
ncbi:MAG: hypothetical protein ACPG7F_11080 [Aggregatilineales bacterium]